MLATKLDELLQPVTVLNWKDVLNSWKALIDLRGNQPNVYATWVERWNKARADKHMVKADQPAHRCVQHLLLLMIRTIERVAAGGSGGGDGDLRVSAKEMRRLSTV